MAFWTSNQDNPRLLLHDELSFLCIRVIWLVLHFGSGYLPLSIKLVITSTLYDSFTPFTVKTAD